MSVFVTFLCGFIWKLYGNPDTFDCPMRELLMEYAININNNITYTQLNDIKNALDGTPQAIYHECNVTIPNDFVEYTRILKSNIDKYTIFVDVNNGNDNNNGTTIYSPFKSILRAVEFSRERFGVNVTKQILLRNGTYYIGETLYFTYLDSNLKISSYNNENVNISGGIALADLDWKLYKKSRNNHDIYYSKIDESINITNILGLRINGYRGIRARYPNVMSEETFPPETYLLNPKTYLFKNAQPQSTYTYNVSEFIRTENNPPIFQYYQLEINGSWFDKYIPPASAPRLNNPHIIGLEYNKNILPNSPYVNMTNGVVRAWHIDHWYSWMWEIDNDKSNDKKLYFYDSGGNQGSDPGDGDTFYIENIFEELDELNEWYFNDTERILYYIPNNTNINDAVFEGTKLKTVMEFNGNQTHPISNIVINGLNFIDTEYTFLDDHGDSPGGGWGYTYNSAINLIGTKNVNITNNYFSRLDGSGILLFGYNRDVNIKYNEFVWIGDTCIGLWGNTIGYDFPELNNTNKRYAKLGINGTNLDQPRDISVSHNIAHEFGINEKQSSFYFQTISCSNKIHNNIVYNGPRAGILINDGFGGNNRIYSNIIFNQCRESSDHGPINTWDHTPYITKVKYGTESVTKEWDHIYSNFLISEYEADYQIDNDDNSQYFKNYDNFCVYGYWAYKSNMGGHDIQAYNNIYAYVNYCIQLYYTLPLNTNPDIMNNNTCIINSTVNNNEIFNYAFIGPDFADPNCYGFYPNNFGGWISNNNTIMINNGNNHNTGYCNVSINDIQKVSNNEIGTSVQEWPSTEYILNKAKQILFQ